ncbi:Excision repair cross-complementing rodent repair deficiency complementation group 4 [Paragonimus heterotremus]|uniref:Excision repair cross-complementing rodent repair deficiency complementation group 4 n=1 Tax=Paragonimus heterotremus TaxID=100268 RepID=A0A8J4T5Q8_9TREM|nr:Excision repair cross-complementing rodent repair deficiency complementation group 4 [Paragonimus heterotremus]
MHELLEYEASVLLDIHQDSSLLVMAEGMGIDTILYCTLKLHSDPHNLILVSNYRLPEARFLCELLTRDNVLHPPSIITAEVSNKDREAMYKRGGVVFVTSRILVVDLLMERMPASLVSGVLILRTHELQEACQENFAIQLLRERNPSIFIKALSDNAISLTSGYNHAERIMTQAGIPRLILWPRFNIQVVSCFANTQPQVEEVRVKLTEQMAVCQSCILDLIKACIKELVDQNSMLNTDELSLENALLPNFDGLVSWLVRIFARFPSIPDLSLPTRLSVHNFLALIL